MLDDHSPDLVSPSVSVPASDPPVRPRVGVALGGGSARGYAHIGVLAALERRDLAPQVLVGTSFGAVIAALYAMGRSPAELRAEAERLRRRDVLPKVMDNGLRRGALFHGRRLEAYFESLVGDRRIEDLPLVLAVVTTDVDSGEPVVLRRGPLATALRASASLPGLFAPVPWEGKRLIDGGIGAPVPLSTLAGFELDLAIGVGAGVEVSHSRTLRVARRAARSRAGLWLQDRLRGPAASATVGPWPTLGRALALTLEAWSLRQEMAADVEDERLHVQTRPPIHWLRFDRAAAAIAAGDEAMEHAWPRLGRLVAAWSDRRRALPG